MLFLLRLLPVPSSPSTAALPNLCNFTLLHKTRLEPNPLTVTPTKNQGDKSRLQTLNPTLRFTTSQSIAIPRDSSLASLTPPPAPPPPLSISLLNSLSLSLYSLGVKQSDWTHRRPGVSQGTNTNQPHENERGRCRKGDMEGKKMKRRPAKGASSTNKHNSLTSPHRPSFQSFPPFSNLFTSLPDSRLGLSFLSLPTPLNRSGRDSEPRITICLPSRRKRQKTRLAPMPKELWAQRRQHQQGGAAGSV
ncbi:hypothetical protein Mapa_006906 [Marchantia paleacea]|nr:hypothetical protein Mapa_006906 [Marchantia paleacea]